MAHDGTTMQQPIELGRLGNGSSADSVPLARGPPLRWAHIPSGVPTTGQSKAVLLSIAVRSKTTCARELGHTTTTFN